MLAPHADERRKWLRRLGWAGMLGALWFSLQALWLRDLWCDEAITLLNFVPLPFAQIYTTYSIANNHIGYSLFLKLFQMFNFGLAEDYFLRLGSMGLGAGALALLYGHAVRRWRNPLLVLAVLAPLAISMPFALYGTALRGYMAGFFCVVCALLAGGSALRGRSWAWGGYALSALAAVAVLPSDILALAGVVWYLAPGCGRNFWRSGRFWSLALIPLGALALFYLPIAAQVRQVLALKEGWSSGVHALGAVYLGFAVALAPGILLSLGGWHRMKDRWRLLVFLLPVVPVLWLNPAPFPRTFFPLWAVWSLLVVEAAARGWERPLRRHWVIGGMVALAACAGSVGLRCAAPFFSDMSGGARWGTHQSQDDWFAPYYLREDYTIRRLAEELSARKLENAPLFLSFDADPFAILWYAPLRKALLWNTPQTHLRSGTRLVLAVSEEEKLLPELMRRFEIKNRPVREFSTGFHTIYKVL